MMELDIKLEPEEIELVRLKQEETGALPFAAMAYSILFIILVIGLILNLILDHLGFKNSVSSSDWQTIFLAIFVFPLFAGLFGYITGLTRINAIKVFFVTNRRFAVIANCSLLFRREPWVTAPQSTQFPGMHNYEKSDFQSFYFDKKLQVKVLIGTNGYTSIAIANEKSSYQTPFLKNGLSLVKAFPKSVEIQSTNCNAIKTWGGLLMQKAFPPDSRLFSADFREKG